MESLEILFWLAVFVIIALRGARSRSGSGTSGEPSPRADTTPEPPRRTDRGERWAPEAARRDSDRGRSSRSLRGAWTDIAREIERQLEVRARAGAPGAGAPAHAPLGGRRSGPTLELPEPDSDHLITISGRRVYPEIMPDEGDIAPEEVPSRPLPSAPLPAEGLRSGKVARHAAPRAVEASGGRRRHGGHGLSRLEGYSALQRAVLLSEVLAPPPGLSARATFETPYDRLQTSREGGED